MKTNMLPIILVISTAATVCGQGHEQAGWAADPSSGALIAIYASRADGQSGPVQGKPFSGTEVRRSIQKLANGAQLDRSWTTTFHRDAVGRMREESPTTALIFDPLHGVVYVVDHRRKTWRRQPLSANATATSVAVAGESTWIDSRLASPAPRLKPGVVVEQLPPQVINGVRAAGTRTTMKIPAGAIGNDRELAVVNERWQSDEMQVLVRTSNSDPRYGTTTYELMNIRRAAPDPSLFEPPAAYVELTRR